MKNVIEVNVECYGVIRLDNEGGYYSVTDRNGNYLGELYPDEFESWDENDENIMAACLEDAFNDGTLETVISECYGEYED